MDIENVITVAQFAERWGVSGQWIRKLIRQGEIVPSGTIGRTWIISEAEYRRVSKSTGR